VGDVSHAGGVEAIFEAVLDDGAPLDILVTNSGASTATDPDADVSVNPWDRDIRHVSDASWRRLTATHLDGTFYFIRRTAAGSSPEVGQGRAPRQRRPPKHARTSSTNMPGCSNAAKWPPQSTSRQYRRSR
jgi:NAD(P)-dependent dehydrogenase (short-subunit alcohol dehydrogenase family)